MTMNDPGAAIANVHDGLLRFLIEVSGVRGVLVRLSDTWAAVRQRADYPQPLVAGR